MFNWEELGKISSDLLRTMRYITFGEYRTSYDGAFFGAKRKVYGEKEVYLHELDSQYKMFNVKERKFEEWPSEKWNYQDKFALKSLKSMKVPLLKREEAPEVSGDEASSAIDITHEELEELLLSVRGIGKKKLSRIFAYFNYEELVNILEREPKSLANIKGINIKLVKRVEEAWSNHSGLVPLSVE
jgi:DNA uptake protein ComE-like DNA-binding protein